MLSQGSITGITVRRNRSELKKMATAATTVRPLDTGDLLMDSLLVDDDSLDFTQSFLTHKEETQVVQMMQDEKKMHEKEKHAKEENEPSKDDLDTDRTEVCNLTFGSVNGHVMRLHGIVNSYKDSLQFTQHEVDLLKEENVYLKNRIEELELEEKRNGYQIQKNNEKLDKHDTMARRKNLVLEGLREKENEKWSWERGRSTGHDL